MAKMYGLEDQLWRESQENLKLMTIEQMLRIAEVAKLEAQAKAMKYLSRIGVPGVSVSSVMFHEADSSRPAQVSVRYSVRRDITPVDLVVNAEPFERISRES